MEARGRRPHADQVGKRRDDHDQRQAYAHAGQRHTAHRVGGLDMADIHPVHQIIEKVDDLRRNGRRSQLQQQLAHRLPAQSFRLFLLHGIRLFPVDILPCFMLK